MPYPALPLTVPAPDCPPQASGPWHCQTRCRRALRTTRHSARCSCMCSTWPAGGGSSGATRSTRTPPACPTGAWRPPTLRDGSCTTDLSYLMQDQTILYCTVEKQYHMAVVVSQGEPRLVCPTGACRAPILRACLCNLLSSVIKCFIDTCGATVHYSKVCLRPSREGAGLGCDK